MKAALVQAFDAPPIYTDFDTPTAAAGEQLVTVTAAGLHQVVKSIANGSHYLSAGKLPFIPGVDGVGFLADGTRIYFGGARFPYGTMCEQTVIGNLMVIPLPAGLEDALAAGIANPGMSSWVA
jgi:NADPH:quinone reductase-like Zn-dependent oxidoreductase